MPATFWTRPLQTRTKPGVSTGQSMSIMSGQPDPTRRWVLRPLVIRWLSLSRNADSRSGANRAQVSTRKGSESSLAKRLNRERARNPRSTPNRDVVDSSRGNAGSSPGSLRWEGGTLRASEVSKGPSARVVCEAAGESARPALPAPSPVSSAQLAGGVPRPSMDRGPRLPLRPWSTRRGAPGSIPFRTPYRGSRAGAR